MITTQTKKWTTAKFGKTLGSGRVFAPSNGESRLLALASRCHKGIKVAWQLKKTWQRARLSPQASTWNFAAESGTVERGWEDGRGQEPSKGMSTHERSTF